MGQVTYPILCSIQDNDNRLRDAYRRLIRASAFIVFPMLIGLAALAKPFIIVLITEKWAPAIPYLQILCFALMWYPVHVLNLNLLTVKGRSDLFLRLEIIKKVLAVCIIFISVPLGIIAMCYGRVVTSVLCLFINTYYTGKLIKVGFMKQMQDLTPTLLYALSMGALVWFTIQWIPNLVLQIIIGIVVGVIYYLGIAKLTKSADLEYVIILRKENVIKRFKK
jgi:O-antigen/teichoic acid export membrane protein